jgi:hypothetical protein
MSSLKISQLTATTTNTIGSWVIVNNSGETTSNKSELEYVLGLSIGSGADSIRSNDLLTTSGGTASGPDSIAIGNGATALDDQSIAIGRQAYAARERDIAIGYGANTDLTESQDGVAIGTDARVVRDYGIAIGYDAIALTDGIAIGRSTRPIGDTCTAIGRQNVAAGNRGYAIGASIFADRDDAGAIGSTLYVDGANSIAVGSNNNIGQTGGQCANSVNIGYNNDIETGDNQIVIGSNAISKAKNTINISSGGELRTTDFYSLLIGGSGNTYAGGSVGLGEGNIKIGGFNDNFLFTPPRLNVFIGGSGNTYNAGAALGLNNVFLGLTGKTTPAISNHTLVENLFVYGQAIYSPIAFTDAGSCIFNPTRNHYVNVTATGGTYNITSNVNPEGPQQQIVFYIEYFSGATVNFTDGTGFITWRWNKDIYGGNAPVFSASTAGTPSRSIITVATWDNEDYFEVSRSMNME